MNKTQRKGIVVIDDDPVSLFLTSELTSHAIEEIELHTFQRANDALHFLNKSSGNLLVLLDLNMPVMNGWEFLDACTNFGIDVEVYILSSSVNPGDMSKAKTYAKVTKFLSKPLNTEDLAI
jgi:CheY-like chemotaxis protein